MVGNYARRIARRSLHVIDANVAKTELIAIYFDTVCPVCLKSSTSIFCGGWGLLGVHCDDDIGECGARVTIRKTV